MDTLQSRATHHDRARGIAERAGIAPALVAPDLPLFLAAWTAGNPAPLHKRGSEFRCDRGSEHRVLGRYRVRRRGRGWRLHTRRCKRLSNLRRGICRHGRKMLPLEQPP